MAGPSRRQCTVQRIGQRHEVVERRCLCARDQGKGGLDGTSTRAVCVWFQRRPDGRLRGGWLTVLVFLRCPTYGTRRIREESKRKRSVCVRYEPMKQGLQRSRQLGRGTDWVSSTARRPATGNGEDNDDDADVTDVGSERQRRNARTSTPRTQWSWSHDFVAFTRWTPTARAATLKRLLPSYPDSSFTTNLERHEGERIGHGGFLTCQVFHRPLHERQAVALCDHHAAQGVNATCHIRVVS